MTTRKSSVFYGLLIAFTSLVVGIIIASRLDLTPLSSAADGPLAIPATNSDPLDGPIDATTFRNIAKVAGPAVVSIRTITMRPVRQGGTMEDFFGLGNPNGRGDRQQPEPETEEVPSAGSGFIIDKNGYILTNNHVVEDAKDIQIYLSTMPAEGDGLAAKVIGRDELTDTALLQLVEAPSDLPVAKFGDSAQMAPGDWVMAIGNPFNLSNTVTVGIVSAVGRPNQVASGRSQEFIQTDAAINQGNSGGPLLNIRGEVIGINSMILTNERLGSGNIGVGFAIPINNVRDLLPQLREGKVTRGKIGVVVIGRPLTEQYSKELGLPHVGGAEVSETASGGPADTAGVRAADVVVEFNGKPVRSNDELVSLVTATRPNTTVPMKVVRNRKTLTLNVTVEELDLAAEQGQQTQRSFRTDEPQDTGFGMSINPVTPQVRQTLKVPADRGGAVVVEVSPNGPAAQAGITSGDVVLSIQGQDVSTPTEVGSAIESVGAGGIARVIVWRVNPRTGGGREVFVPVRKR